MIDFACPAKVYPNFQEVCEAVQGYLQEVGIQAHLELMAANHYWELESNNSCYAAPDDPPVVARV